MILDEKAQADLLTKCEFFEDIVELVDTSISTIYKIKDILVLKMFQENDDTMMLKKEYLLNHVFEIQIKKVHNFFKMDMWQFYDVDVFVLSPEMPPKLLDYSSAQTLNRTLGEVKDPEEFEYRIYQSLDYLVFLH